jgi:hypothetical protein
MTKRKDVTKTTVHAAVVRVAEEMRYNVRSRGRDKRVEKEK